MQPGASQARGVPAALLTAAEPRVLKLPPTNAAQLARQGMATGGELVRRLLGLLGLLGLAALATFGCRASWWPASRGRGGRRPASRERSARSPTW